MLNTIFYILSSRLLWGFLGITALSLIIWVIGPVFAISGSSPLEPELNRQLSIALLYLVWGFGQVVPRLHSAWLNKKLVSSLGAQEEADNTRPLLNDEDQILAQRFNEASQLLKKAHFNTPGRKRPNWVRRFSRQYIYQLPWYVIIGAPGAGKTTALINSGLHFPLADSFGKTALRGIGGTRNCDWWFTNEAVLLDTAGRYTTQESQREQDASEWHKFINLLKKYRARQPVNGAIITISVADLFSLNAEQRQQQARQLRQRLLELHEQLGIRFPVYVLITKTDLLKGFTAYFDSFDSAKRDQVWGFTFPWAELKTGNFDLQLAFEHEYTLLQQRLDAGLADVMQLERDGKARAESYLFPQEFAALRPLLGDYLSQVFAHSGYDSTLSARGIYFASGTQEGQPFDKVMGELNRKLHLPENANRAASSTNSGSGWDKKETTAPIPPVKGRSFFLRNMLEKVVFNESGLAGSNRWWEMRNRVAVWSGYLLLSIALVIAAILWFISYGNNRDYLQQVSAKVPAVNQQGQALQAGSLSDMFALVPYLDSLLHLPESSQFDINHPPLSLRMGLYRGAEVSDASNTLYQKALKQLLLAQVAQQITGWLRNDNGSDADYSYEALKAYQMLYLPKHYDGKFLHAWVMFNLQRNLPQSITRDRLSQLDWHLSQLLESQIQTSPYAKDDALIAREQALIARMPLSNRVYGRLQRLLSHDASLKPVSLTMLGGPQSELVFTRKSGKPLSEGISGLYTPDGYWNHFDQQIANVEASLHADDRWVLGNVADDSDKAQTDSAVRQLYIDDYIRQWDGLLGDIQLNNIANLSQRVDSARLLSSDNSPLRTLVIGLSHYLNLDKPAQASGASAAGKSANADNSSARALNSLFNGGNAGAQPALQTPEQKVSQHFASLLQLAQPLGQGGKAIVFDDFIKQIDDLYHYLIAAQDAVSGGMPAPEGGAITRLQASAGRLPGSLQGMFTSLALGASTDTQRGTMDNLRKRIDLEIGSFCHQAIAGRYPLSRSARNDVTPEDLARMFAPGSGLMDAFFRDNLAGKVDTTQAQWRMTAGIDGKTLPGSEGMLRPFQQAQSIRDAFFTNGATTPSYRVTVRTLSMDNDILSMTLDIDGQFLRYSHGPQAQQLFSWPGSGGTNQVRLSLGLANGTTSTLVTSGPWALNRLFDQARQSSEGGSLSRQASFTVDGHHLTLEFTPDSIRNPFQLPGFSCP